MKVRFYRGPLDGKIRDIDPTLTTITVAHNSSKQKNFSYYTMPAMNAVTFNQSTYTRTRHTHPDGSVFFEWDKPKGTKI